MQGHLVTLDLGSLGLLADGQAEAVNNAALRSAAADVEDRGDDGKPRKVTITVVMKKVKDSDMVLTTIEAKPTLPNYLTKPTFAYARMEGAKPTIQFNPHSAANPNQMTINDVIGGDQK
jgi:hypothetical protein